MEEVKSYNLSYDELKKLSILASNAYNTAVVVNYFVTNQPEIEERYNLAPVIRNLKHDLDLINVFFIDNGIE